MPRPASAVHLESFEVFSHDGTKAAQDGKRDAFVPVKLTKVFPEHPKPGENRIRFEPVRSTRFQLWFHHGEPGSTPESMD